MQSISEKIQNSFFLIWMYVCLHHLRVFCLYRQVIVQDVFLTQLQFRNTSQSVMLVVLEAHSVGGHHIDISTVLVDISKIRLCLSSTL